MNQWTRTWHFLSEPQKALDFQEEQKSSFPGTFGFCSVLPILFTKALWAPRGSGWFPQSFFPGYPLLSSPTHHPQTSFFLSSAHLGWLRAWWMQGTGQRRWKGLDFLWGQRLILALPYWGDKKHLEIVGKISCNQVKPPNLKPRGHLPRKEMLIGQSTEEIFIWYQIRRLPRGELLAGSSRRWEKKRGSK